MVDQEQRALTISEVAVDWQELMVLQSKCGHPLPALTDTGPAAAASKHTTAPINHTRPSPRKQSPDVTTPSKTAEPDYCLLPIYRPRKDERLSWPSWLTCRGTRMVYQHKWSPISCRSSTGQGKFAGQRLTFYYCATQPTKQVHSMETVADCEITSVDSWRVISRWDVKHHCTQQQSCEDGSVVDSPRGSSDCPSMIHGRHSHWEPSPAQYRRGPAGTTWIPQSSCLHPNNNTSHNDDRWNNNLSDWDCRLHLPSFHMGVWYLSICIQSV